MELVAGTGQPSQPEPLEPVMHLQVSEAHRDALPLIARLDERLRFHLPSRDAGVLVKIARYLAASSLVQHFALRGQTSQSRFEAR
jgi:hypothetical protein